MHTFTDYTKSLNKDELISTVGYIYRSFKGTSNLVPNLGYNGCIQLAPTLLLFKYLSDKECKVSGKISRNTAALMVPIVYAFNGFPAGVLLSHYLESLEKAGGSGLVMEWLGVCASFEDDEIIYNGINRFEFASSRTRTADQNYENAREISNLFLYSEQQGMRISDKMNGIK